MIDIVERLREIQHDGFGRPIVSSVLKAAGEAADLIERLRVKLGKTERDLERALAALDHHLKVDR